MQDEKYFAIQSVIEEILDRGSENLWLRSVLEEDLALKEIRRREL
jgi:hypothetical protein